MEDKLIQERGKPDKYPLLKEELDTISEKDSSLESTLYIRYGG